MKTGLIKMDAFVKIARNYFADTEINIIFEIGCMDGRDSKYLKQQYPNATVYAIEGLEDNYIKYLKDLPDITCFNYVIFETDGEVDYYKKETNGIHGVFNRKVAGTEIIKSNSYRIDTVCKMHNIPAIDMVKLDVEGASLEVLKSFGDIIDTVKIMHVETEEVEFFKGQRLHPEVANYLELKGFTMIDMSGVLVQNQGYQYDSIWIKR